MLWNCYSNVTVIMVLPVPQHPTSTWQVSAVTYNVHFSYVGPSSDLEQTSCIVCFLKIFGRLQGSRLILSKRSEAVFYHHINHKHTAYWNCNKYIKSTVLYEGRYFAWVVTYSLKFHHYQQNFAKLTKSLRQMIVNGRNVGNSG